MICDGLNRQPVVTVQQSSPGLVAYRGGALRGISSMSPSNASTSPVKKA
jgi:hypothetical protein